MPDPVAPPSVSAVSAAPTPADAPTPASASELTAQQKFACPLCGGEARWDPAKQALVCAYCGTASPVKHDPATGAIQEHDLVAALRDVPDDQRGWMTETRSVRCQSCQAVTVLPAGRAVQKCAFCGSTEIVDYQELRAPIRPESLMAFKVSEAQVRDAAHAWYKTRWFAPDALKKSALTDEVHGFYLPYWAFNAQAHCPWTAEAGYYYYETETYTDDKGQRQTREVQRTRWEYAAGSLDHFFKDQLVAASRGVPGDLITQINPFPTADQLVPYEGSYLSGWVVEQYQIDLKEAAARAEQAMDAELQKLCRAEVPGDTERNLAIFPIFSQQTFKHVLLPVWVLSYRYQGTAYQMLVNGYTGQVAGRYPKSWIKITLLVVAILLVLLIVVALSQHHR